MKRLKLIPTNSFLLKLSLISYIFLFQQNLLAQVSDDSNESVEGFRFFLTDDEENEIQYERGAFTKYSDSVIGVDDPNYSNDQVLESAIRTLNAHVKRGDGSHIKFMDISDEEFNELLPLLKNTLIELLTENENIYRKLCADFSLAYNSGYRQNSLQDLVDSYLINLNSTNQIKLRSYNNLKSNILNNLSEEVFNEFEKFISIFSLNSSHSYSNEVTQIVARGENPENHLLDICL